MRRFDLLFSYWIFTWYLCFLFGWTHYNPTFLFIVAIVFSMCTAGIMYFYTNRITILLFILATVLTKIIPLFTIQNHITIRDLIASVILFLIYLGWIYLNGLPLNYELTHLRLVIHNKAELPFSFFIKKMLKLKTHETSRGA